MSEPYRQGQRDFQRGATQPPKSYYSDYYKTEWQRGFDDAMAADDAKRAEAAAEDERWRYLPPSYRALHELEQALGAGNAALIKSLVEAMIAEAAPDYNGG